MCHAGQVAKPTTLVIIDGKQNDAPAVGVVLPADAVSIRRWEATRDNSQQQTNCPREEWAIYPQAASLACVVWSMHAVAAECTVNQSSMADGGPHSQPTLHHGP